MKVKVIGEIQGKSEYGYIGKIPRGFYEVTIDGLVFLKGVINKWTLFMKNFQQAIQEKTIKIIEE